MGAEAAAGLILQLITTAFGAAKNAGLVGNPDWVKYADAGLYMAGKAKEVLFDIFANPDKYDAMTPEQIKALLTPKTWDEIEAQALAEFNAEGGAPTP
jgi:aspartate/methionine/tyrosine aminotransferase